MASRTTPISAPASGASGGQAPGKARSIDGTLTVKPDSPCGPTSMVQTGGATPTESKSGWEKVNW